MIKPIEYSNAIFEGTLLEGIPFNYKYVWRRPKNFYKVKGNKITLHNYPKWRPHPSLTLEPAKLASRVRKLYLHDTCHAILFYAKNQTKRIFMNDFGMTWDHVDTIKEDPNCYHIKVHSHLMDEFKVSALYFILMKTFRKEKPYTRKAMQDLVFKCQGWHTAKIFKGDELDPKVVAKRNIYVKQAVDYWYDMGLNNVRQLVRNMVRDVKLLQENKKP